MNDVYIDEKKGEIGPRTYRIKRYPEPDERAPEAQRLCATARALFFSIAEDGIGVGGNVLDDKGVLMQGTLVQKGQVWLDQRKALAEAQPLNRMAQAKLAGAYIHMMEILAEERIAQTQRGETDEANQTRRTISAYQREAVRLLPYIRLRGGAVDIDQVLQALLGEVTKASSQTTKMAQDEEARKAGDAIKMAHDDEYRKAGDAMYQVDTLCEWMQQVTRRHPEFSACTPLILTLAHQAKFRLDLRRDDLARDVAEIGFDQAREILETEIKSVRRQGPVLTTVGEYMLQATALIFDMLKQGEKPMSMNLVLAMDQADLLNKALDELLAQEGMPRNIVAKTDIVLHKLHLAVSEQLRHILRDGKVSPARENEFAKACEEAEKIRAELVPVYSRLGDGDKREALELLERGLGILTDLPPRLAQTLDARGISRERVEFAPIIKNARMQATQFLEAFEQLTLRMKAHGGP